MSWTDEQRKLMGITRSERGAVTCTGAAMPPQAPGDSAVNPREKDPQWLKDAKPFLRPLFQRPDEAEEAKRLEESVATEETDVEEEEEVDEKAPPGWEGTVKAMKKHPEIDNPWALAWSMKNKGYKSRKREGTDFGNPLESKQEAKIGALTALRSLTALR